MPECTADAYAKINIGLDIGTRKPDGYHPIASIFQSVGLCDTIILRTTDMENELSIIGTFDCPPLNTTIAKAVAAIRKKSGILKGLHIEVTKRIPVMAGMGGGSADAAATLIAFDRLFDLHLNRDELVAISGKIGADVPFFLFGGAAIVTGIGEVIQPIKTRTDFGLLVIEPGFGVSTPDAYAELDKYRQGRLDIAPVPTVGKWESEYWGAISSWSFKNSFEPILESEHPSYALLRRQLSASGAAFVSITGSGACMFGVYDSIAKARTASKRFATALLPGLRIHALQPLETSIVLR